MDDNQTTDIVQTQAQEIAALSAKIEALTDAVRMLCVQQGARSNKQQLADHLGVHRNTITNMLERDRRMPRPGKDGKWLLSEIVTGPGHHTTKKGSPTDCLF